MCKYLSWNSLFCLVSARSHLTLNGCWLSAGTIQRRVCQPSFLPHPDQIQVTVSYGESQSWVGWWFLYTLDLFEILFGSSHLPLAENCSLLPFRRKCLYLHKAQAILLWYNIYIYMHMNNTLDLLNDFLLESKGHLWLIACHVAILVFC